MTASAGCGLVVPSESETRVYKKWSGGVRRATTLCIMSTGGDEMFWHWVSGTRCQFGGDNLGVAVEEQNRVMTRLAIFEMGVRYGGRRRNGKCNFWMKICNGMLTFLLIYYATQMRGEVQFRSVESRSHHAWTLGVVGCVMLCNCSFPLQSLKTTTYQQIIGVSR